MNSRFIILPLLLSIFLLQQQQSLGQSRADRKVIKRLQADINYLASDELEGRRTGSEGEKKAADFIIQQYEDGGIKPYKGKYIHPFNFVYGKTISANTQIKVAGTFTHLNEEAFPLPFSANKHAYSEVLPDVMEQGSVWMIGLYSDKDEANDPHFDCEKSMFDRSKDAAEHGATGVLFYDSYGSKYPPEFNGRSEYESVTIPVAFLSYNAYQKYVQNNTNYKERESVQIDLNIVLDKPERTGNNIAAYIDNGAPYTVIIGAHYDHLGHGEDGNTLYTGKDHPVFNGADDNASGTAAVLEVARWIKKNKLYYHNYLFINFSGEELGLLGSKAFVKNNKLDSGHIAYMINMDMVGRLNDSTHSLEVGGIGTSPVWGKLITESNKQFKLVFDSSGVGPSDHTSFYYEGIPVLFFFTGTHKDYHKPSDDADKINYPGEAKVITYVDELVAKMDKEPKPKFTATKLSTVGRTNFKVTLGIMPDYSFQDGGVRIDGVSDGRPAMKAGLKEGDIITQLGEYKVNGMQSYMEALSHFNKGDKTKVTVQRNGKKITLPMQFDK